jgi:hypothetical protein
MNNEYTLLHNDFKKQILLDPIKQGAKCLKIVSGYATPTMVSWHIKAILESEEKLSPIKITLIVGMCGIDGISKASHEGFNEIVSKSNKPNLSKFICQYLVSGAPVHSKLYLWERDGVPFRAFMGSANYTQAAFSRFRRELLQECNPLQALEYYNTIEPDTMYCNHAEIEDNIKISSKPIHPILETEKTPLISIQGSDAKSVNLSLLTNKDDVGFGSGINWGHRIDGTKREPNQMYISLPVHVKRSNPNFFPIIGNPSGKGNPNFSVLTDDGVNFILRVQQGGNKGITTPLDNSRIGEYFRSRIGVSNGAFVTKQDLENYGRTDVTFYKLDDEHYFMDFSV